jgi:Tfp pilus assembly PilM family ATPase
VEGDVIKFAELQPMGGGRHRVGRWGARSFREVTEAAPQDPGDMTVPVDPLEQIVPGGPLNQPWTVKALRKLKRYPVFASFADSDVLVKFITLPDLSEQEIAGMVELRHREYLPLPNAQVVYDFSIVRFLAQLESDSEEAAEDQAEMRVMVTGAERGTYLMYRETIAQEGIILRSLETNQAALTRACNHLLGPESSGTYAALYLSETYSIIIFVVEGGLYYSRLLEQGLVALTPDETGKRRVERLLRELYRSVDFFSVESRGVPIEKLYVINGGANPDSGTSHRIRQFLASRLSVDVQTLQEAMGESDRITLPQGQLVGTLLLPIGLALRAHTEGGM